MTRRIWVSFLGLFGLALVAYLVIPGSSVPVGFLVLVGCCALVTLVRTVRVPRAGSLPLWLLSGTALFSAAGLFLQVGLDLPNPGLHDVGYVAGYLCGVSGTALLIRRRERGRDREGLLDALIISSGFGLLSWVFLIKPAQAAAGSPLAAIVLTSFPVFDVFIVALLVRLLLSGGLRDTSMRLVAASQVATLATDCAFAFVDADPVTTPFTFRLMTAVSLLTFAFFAAATLHPGFARLGVEPPAAAPGRPWLRTVLLCAASVTGPALLVAEAYLHDMEVRDAFAIAAGCALVFSLVVVRLQVLVGRVNAQSATLTVQAEQLRELAERDGLTGLVNRRAWDVLVADGLRDAGRAGIPASVVILDLDHFKRWNDTRGHQAGDALLQDAAAEWGDQLRSADVLARYGGEEFVLLLPGCDPAAADRIVGRLRSATPHGQTFSAGIAMWDGVETPDRLVARADAALYEAKAAGRDRSVVARFDQAPAGVR